MGTSLGRYIVIDPAIYHGQPTFRGTRILVTDVLEQVASGMAWEAIIEEWRGAVTKEAIAEAVRLAREALREGEKNYRMVLEHIDEIVYRVDIAENDLSRGIVQFVSGRAEDAIGYTPDDFLNDPELWFRLLHPDDVQAVKEQTRKIFATRKGGTREYRLRHKQTGNYHWMEDRVVLQLGEAGQVVNLFGVARDITERKLAEEELQSSREQLRALSARLQSIGEEEKTRIAREIHDECGQVLTALKMDLSYISRKLRDLNNTLVDVLLQKIDSMSRVIDSMIARVHQIAMDLRPDILDNLGLIEAIGWYGEEFQSRTGIACLATFPDFAPVIEQACATALFRILQETLTNVARHSRATLVEITVRQNDHHISLEVRDNGRGISENEIHNRNSLGILGMKERAFLLGGEFKVSGVPGQGTTVSIKMPLQ